MPSAIADETIGRMTVGSRRFRRAAVALTGAIIVSFGMAATAQAGTLSAFSSGFLFTGASGEVNDVSVSAVGTVVTIVDSAQVITVTYDPGSVCTGGGTKTVVCGFPADDTTPSVQVQLGDMGDAETTGSLGDVEVSSSGGEGDDTFIGGPSVDRFTGDAGADSMSGGEGDDDLDGGSGDDPLLLGGPGRDFIDGDSGNDSIDGGADRESCEEMPGATRSTEATTTIG